MKNHLHVHIHKKILILFFLVFVAFPWSIAAQNSLAIVWSTETGCQLNSQDGPRKYLENVSDGNCIRICENFNVEYTLIGDTSSISSTVWTVSGGTILTSSTLDCIISWGATGVGTITNIINFTNGTSSTYVTCIEIIEGPKAYFTSFTSALLPDFESCIGEDIYFTNLSTAGPGSPITSYYWDFGDGTTSAMQEPIHSYDSSGTYSVSLTVTNSCNCKSTQIMDIEVGKEGIEITCVNVQCEGTTANYTAKIDGDPASTRCAEMFWSVEGGHIVSPSSIFPYIDILWDVVDDSGFGYVSFDSSNCDVKCPGITTIKVPVIKAIGKITGPTEVCGKQQYIYSLPKWPTTEFNWTISGNIGDAQIFQNDQRNEIVLDSPSTPGTIILNCTYFNTLLHCGGQATITIIILPESSITGPKILCAGAEQIYTLINDIDSSVLDASWNLEGPGGNQSDFGTSFEPDFSLPGTYTMTASSPGFCTPETTIITVDPVPVAPDAINGPERICPLLANTYTVTTTVDGTDIVWEVTGGEFAGSDSGQSVTIIFDATGPYEVRAYHINKKAPHCKSLATVKEVILLNPDLDITSTTTFNPVCSSTDAVYVVREGIDPYVGGETYEWTIDPPTAGSVVSGNNTNTVTVLWNTPSTPFATLSVSVTQCGLPPFIASQEITVVTSPPITITTANSTVCAGSFPGVQFALSGYSSGDVFWNFGDGVTSTNSSPIHAFNQNNPNIAIYNVTVTIQNPNGCFNPVTASYEITVLPVPPATITTPGDLDYCDESEIEKLILSVQTGLGSTTQVLWYQYAIPTPILMETEIAGSALFPLDGEFDPPTFGTYYAVVTYGNLCQTQAFITIVQNCQDPDCEIVLSPAGEPTVHLEGELTTCGTFDVYVTLGGTPPIDENWTYNGLTASSLTAISGTFISTVAGYRRVTYEAIYNQVGGGTCSIIQSINVLVPYIAQMSYAITCGGNPASYTLTLYDRSTTAGSPALTRTFKEGTTTLATNVFEHVITGLVPGSTHTYKLILTDGIIPCEATITITMPVVPSAAFTVSSFPVCPGEPITFTATDTTPGLTYEWDFGDSSFNQLAITERAYPEGGTYPVTLTVKNAYGCEITSSIANTSVFDVDISGSIFPPSATACTGDSISLNFIETSVTATLYQWMNGTGPVVGATSSSYSATFDGSYWLKATDANGCSVNLNSSPANLIFIKSPNVTIEGPSNICTDEPFSLTGYAGATGTTFNWFINGIPQYSWDNQTEITHTFAIPGTYTFTLITSIPNGTTSCSSTATHTVTVSSPHDFPEITFAITDCKSYKIELAVQNVDPTGTYTWSNGGSGPIITAYEGGPFMVRYTNEQGCSVTAQIEVPKNPDNFMWVFPRGCYSLCKDFEIENFTLIGPAPAANINELTWHLDTVVVATHDESSTNTDYTITSLGSYQLGIANLWCSRVSEPLTISEKDCEDCDLKINPKEISVHQDETGCYYVVSIEITNPSTETLYATLSTINGEGVFIPSTLILPPLATATYTLVMYPIAPAFTLGSITINLNATDALQEKECKSQFELMFSEDCEVDERLVGNLKATFIKKQDDVSILQIVPNPAENATEIAYKFFDSSDFNQNKSLEIYDMIGRAVEIYNIDQSVGVVSLNLENYPSGYYVVIMKQNGNIIKNQKLIVK